MKFLLLFLIVAHPLFGIEDQDDPFRQHASPWVKTWEKEWDGEPWLICVEGEEQYLLHSKSVKEWADQRPFLGHPFDRARNAEELFGPLLIRLVLLIDIRFQLLLFFLRMMTFPTDTHP